MSYQPPDDAQPPEPLAPKPQKRRGRTVGALAGLALLALMVLLLLAGPSLGLFQVLLALLVLSILAATFALARPRARPYAIGYLMFWGVALVVLGGVCVAILSSANAGPR